MGSEVGLFRLFDDCDPAEPLAPYQALVRDWAITYLTGPHADLGREGPVCPFTAASIGKKMFWVGCVTKADLTAGDIDRVFAGVITRFRHLPPTDGPDALLKTIVVLFPAVTDYSIIEEAQGKLKDESVKSGLMVGQFYPGCEEPGIRNSNFRPLQSPLPLLAIRHMVGSDLPFLSAKVEWVDEYLKRFASSIPAPVRTMIATKFGRDDETIPQPAAR